MQVRSVGHRCQTSSARSRGFQRANKGAVQSLRLLRRGHRWRCTLQPLWRHKSTFHRCHILPSTIDHPVVRNVFESSIVEPLDQVAIRIRGVFDSHMAKHLLHHNNHKIGPGSNHLPESHIGARTFVEDFKQYRVKHSHLNLLRPPVLI